MNNPSIIPDITEEDCLKNKKFSTNCIKELLNTAEAKSEKLNKISKNLEIVKKLEAQKDLFIATLVHDLKNSLFAQINALNLFQNESFGNLNETQHEMLGTILESADYMKEMLVSVLQTYKYENGIIKLNKSNSNIEELMHKCINEIQAAAVSKKVKIVLTSNIQNSQEKIALIDEIQVRRVFANILNNEIFYAYQKTQMFIDISKKEENLVISFQNTSDEIDEKLAGKIFDKYISTYSYKKASFGLGMYLSKKIIEAHGGRIFLIAKGTTNRFVIELPAKTNADCSTVLW